MLLFVQGTFIMHFKNAKVHAFGHKYVVTYGTLHLLERRTDRQTYRIVRSWTLLGRACAPVDRLPSQYSAYYVGNNVHC